MAYNPVARHRKPHVVGGYIRGTLTMALLIGLLVGGGMLVLRVPYAMLLGVLAFFMEFIPIVGVLVSGRRVCRGGAFPGMGTLTHRPRLLCRRACH